MRTYFILLLATALLAPGATVAQTPGTGNGLELDSLSFGELQRLIASRDSVRVAPQSSRSAQRPPARWSAP
ncbi:MAG TPA: hypothetical protein VEM27_04945 [Gemmatimonadales bacterium]|nr:hypothetical protein [Gemmatimonadales bacterium]